MPTTNDTNRRADRTLRDVVEPLQAELFAVLRRFALPDDAPEQALRFAKLYAIAEVIGTEMRITIEHDATGGAARARCLDMLRDVSLYVHTCGQRAH